ncbi:MAG: uridine kinase family protein [Phycisphaerales bacterium]
MNRAQAPIEVEMAAAPALIAARALEAQRKGTGCFVVAVGGAVGSGKSTLAGRLTPCVISTDDFLPDYDKVPYAERDLPERMDLAALINVLAALRQGQRAEAPVWSFQTHSRIGTREVLPGAVVVCEGIHALTPAIAGVADLRVFVHADPDTRWARWENLERTGQRGWGVETARAFFHAVAEPTFAARVEGYLATAEVIVRNP